MEGSTLGPYRIVRRLGAGGMGSVWLADSPAGRVAVKVLHPHVLEQPGLLERFQREAELGIRVHHENVVRTLATGRQPRAGGEIHYLVMEYVEGDTLRRLLEDLGFLPDNLVREVGRQVAAGLSAIHAAGAIHRDLKPENVLITREDRVRIMDLGVARLMEHSTSLTHADEFAGSLPYAAPEQFGTAEVGPASDLYSLGVLTYELLTGENPFHRSGFVQIMTAHLETVPPPAAEKNREVSPFLSEFAARLLSKEPSARFSSATEVASVLAAGEKSAWWRDRERDLLAREIRRPRIPVSRETPLRGRRDEISAFEDAWRRAVSGHGLVLLVEGEHGLGKTRLLDAFAERIEDPGARILYGAFSPASGLGGLTAALREALGPALETSLAAFLSDTPALAPAFTALVRGEAPPAGAPLLEGDALAGCFAAALAGLARAGPVLWIVDDLDAAGPEAHRAVISIARAVEGRPALVIAAGEPGCFEREAAALGAAPGFRPVLLPRLSPREVLDLVRDGLPGEDVAQRLGARIAWSSDGVPLFALEIIRSLRESGAVARGVEGTMVTTREIREIEIPRSVQDLVRSRFRDLSEEERAILDVAACCGLEFDAEVVAEALGLKVVLALRKLAHLERVRRLVRSEGDRHRFDHRQVREALYAEVPARLRREYHSSIADALAARLPPSPSGAEQAAVARQFLLAGRLSETLPHLDAAVAHLERSYANEAVLELTDLLLSHGAEVPALLRIDVLLRRAARFHLLGNRDEQRRALLDAAALADAAGDPLRRGRARRQLGALCLATAAYDDAAAALDTALPLARAAGAPQEEALILANLAVLATFRGRYAEARDRFADALARARTAGDLRLTSIALRNLGTAQQTIGEYDAAERSFTEAVAVARQASDPRLTSAAVGALGGLRYLKGRKDEALSLMADQQRLARETGDRNLELEAATGLAAVAYALGHLAEARRAGQRSLEIARQIGQREAEGRALVNLGVARLMLGERAEARAGFDEALARAQTIGSRWLTAYATQWRAIAADMAGEDARDELALALSLQRELDHSAGVADALCALGRHLVRRGRPAEAAPFLTEALALAVKTDLADAAVLASAWLAMPGAGGAAADAERLLASSAESADRITLIEAHQCLSAAGAGPRHGAEATKLLAELVDHSPPELRDRMLREVPLFQEVLRTS